MKSPLLLLLILVIVTSAAAPAEERKKPTLAEAKAKFARADAALNAVWEKARSKLKGGDWEELKAEQRNWIEYRDRMATSPGVSGAPAEEAEARQSPEFFVSAAGLTEDRTAFLNGLLAEAGEDTLTGQWMDSYGGYLEIVEKDGRLHFHISVVRGHSAHLGELSGEADWNERIGWFTDKGRDKDRTDVTNLAFIHRDGKKLEIVGANTSHYHGARAYFDGKYVRTGPLDAKTQAELLKPVSEREEK